MFTKTLAFGALASYAYGLDLAVGDAYDVSNQHPAVDDAASSKMTGIIGWQWFFDKYVDAGELADGTTGSPAGFVEDKHVCYFQWKVEQWTSLSTRWALTVLQNCPD